VAPLRSLQSPVQAFLGSLRGFGPNSLQHRLLAPSQTNQLVQESWLVLSRGFFYFPQSQCSFFSYGGQSLLVNLALNLGQGLHLFQPPLGELDV
jgi:hypothetical protein